MFFHSSLWRTISFVQKNVVDCVLACLIDTECACLECGGCPAATPSATPSPVVPVPPSPPSPPGSGPIGPIAGVKPTEVKTLVIDDVTIPYAVAFSGGSLDLPANALSAPVTLVLSVYRISDLPAAWTPGRRRAATAKRLAGGFVVIEPKGTAVKGASLALSVNYPKTDDERYAVNRVIIDPKTYISLSSREIGSPVTQVNAKISVFDAYASVMEPKGSANRGLWWLLLLLLLIPAAAAWYYYPKYLAAGTETKQSDFTGALALVPSTATSMQPGWSSCKGCGNPVKESWPRCPGCKTQVSATSAAAATSKSMALAKTDFQECRGCSNPVKSTWSRCPTCQTSLGGTARSVAPSAAPKIPPGWAACPSCQKPVKSTWVRCPGCQRPGSTAVVAPSAVPQPTPNPSVASAAPLQPGWKGCPSCKKPVRDAWPRCPAPIKGADANKSTVEASVISYKPPTPNTTTAASSLMQASGFQTSCTNLACRAPVKMAWKRCPSCKTPIAK